MNESRGNTSAIAGPNQNGSYDYGLFQINDNYWCEHGKPGNGCQIACEGTFQKRTTNRSLIFSE